MDDLYFDIHARGESLRDKTLINNFYKRAILLYGLRTISLSESLNELCDKSKLLLPEKQAGNISKINSEETVAIIDKINAYQWITPTQHKKN